MGVRVSIGDFAVMAHLSRKALRHYHELGILEPAHIDAATGYRFYDTSQVDQAQLIRRFRSLEMSIPDIKALLSADDAASRTTIVANHLRRMEEQLTQTTNAVAELRELLEPTGSHPHVKLRHEPAATVWSIRAVVDSADIDRWFTASMRRLEKALTTSRTRPDGPLGGVYDRELFSEERGEATLFVPVAASSPPPETVHAETLPPAEVAVLTHTGAGSGIDRTYGMLGAYVHEHLISHEGPIREHYVGAPLSDFTSYTATEICWPIFNTSASPSL
jgi:DNA-binding transcriptional MerR regulator